MPKNMRLRRQSLTSSKGLLDPPRALRHVRFNRIAPFILFCLVPFRKIALAWPAPIYEMTSMQLEGIDHVALSVRDVERSAQWYIDILGFERRFEGMWNGIPVFIGKGETAIALFPDRPNERASSAKAATAPKSTSATRGQIRMLHMAFRA